ncbi:MAG: MgtC/SapB family protein [Chloroflexota bacterium]|nr:MgtC/SapB family protein [Chloroflexota bacterium]
MSLEQQFVGVLELLLAMTLSMVIGLNRERRDKDAGLRTHMLVGLGACLFTVLAARAFPTDSASRIIANIITGIGFLGAGIIYQTKDGTRDLTTAASIWATAAIGMVVGIGAWFMAMCATLLVWVTLEIFWYLRNLIKSEPS